MNLVNSNSGVSTDRIFKLLIIFSAVFFLFTIFDYSLPYALVNNDGWVIADWMINYEGGFVRRGLTGQLLKLSSDPLGILQTVQLLCYLAIIANISLIILKQQGIARYLPILFSPALFLFILNDPEGGFRKEILSFALMSISLVARRYSSENLQAPIFIGLLAIYPALILSHEMLAIMLPIYLAMHIDLMKKSFRTTLIAGCLTTVSVAVFLTCIVNSGSKEIATQICSSIPDFCNSSWLEGGALSALAASPKDSMWAVINSYGQPAIMLNYIVLFILAYLAFIPLYRQIINLLRDKQTVFFLCCFYFGTAVIYTIAMDWGRILHIQIASILLLILAREEFNLEESSTHEISTPPNKTTIIRAIMLSIATALYASFWHMKHVPLECSNLLCELF